MVQPSCVMAMTAVVEVTDTSKWRNEYPDAQKAWAFNIYIPGAQLSAWYPDAEVMAHIEHQKVIEAVRSVPPLTSDGIVGTGKQ